MSLSDLGRRVAELQDREPVPPLNLPGLLRRRPPRRAPSLVAALAAVAAVLVGLWLGRHERGALTYQVGDGPGAAGRPIDASAAPLPLRFSDGTLLELERGSAARVDELDERGATLIIERGLVRAKVIHTETSRWRVLLGPFEVEVTGTTFDASWSPEEARLRVKVLEGSVVVRGPLNGGPRSLRRGDELVITHEERQAVVEPVASAPAPLASARAALPSASIAVVDGPADWRELATRGDDAAAFRLVEPRLDALAAQLSPADMLRLVHVARRGGGGAAVPGLLQKLRERFPGSEEAASAAFLLGRAASGAQAARWLQTYLAEAPSGPFAREALGRWMEAEVASGQLDAARGLARQYLAQYPRGPHASYATQLLAPAP
ncbi:MAG: FecR domain-containing protein [Polyangiaceae bacterium]